MLPGEESLYWWVVYSWIGVAAATFVTLLFVAAPYGRHMRAGWGPMLHRTVGWVLMELPAVIVPLAFFLVSDRTCNPVAIAFLALWMLHYVNRGLVYPFRLAGGIPQMPLSIAAMGFFFNLVNGWLQGRCLFFLGPEHDTTWLADPRFLLGTAMFLGGFVLNQHSDQVLRNLRRPGETGYRIPFGGGYRFVSCPNYLGELTEWAGFALLTWSSSGLLFLLWTSANLVPRARAHHRWYVEKFSDYPKERKAILPFVY